jgi:zinc protease
MRRPSRGARTVLDNGLVVLARENRAARSVAVRLVLPAGGAFDPPGLAGVASLAAGLLDRGAGRLSAEAIALGFDHLGASFLARAGTDTLEIDIRLLSQHLEEILGLLRTIVLEPTFPEEETRRERGQTLTAIAERDQDTAAVALNTVRATLFPPSHPYHASNLGTALSVAKIERSSLVAFNRDHIGPAGAVLAMAGDVDAGRAIDMAAGLFGGWRNGRNFVPGGHRMAIPDPPLPSRAVTVVKAIEGKTQADIVLGFLPGLKRLSPDLPAALVLSSGLGEFGLGGRLGKQIREQQGLAYYAHSFVSSGLGAGPILARAGVAVENVERAVTLMLRTIEGVVKRGLTPAEIRDSKQALASEVPRRLESNRGAAAFLADCEFHGLGVDYPERLPSQIEAVDRKQVETAARNYLTLGRHALVVAGPPAAAKGLRVRPS